MVSDNIKKGFEKFRAHEQSSAHQEAQMKWQTLQRPSILDQMSSRAEAERAIRRKGLLKQLHLLKFLLRQGISLRGHTDVEGNLFQLLTTLKDESDAVKYWLKEGKYMSHDIVNEMITIMGQTVLRQVLQRVHSLKPSWYSILADEATDVSASEQFCLSIRSVDDDYKINEDTVGLFRLPNTTANTLAIVLKDLLTRCALPLSLCRGQAYDGAATMQGIRSGLATVIRTEVPAAISVHCLAHRLNLCLQGAGRKLPLLRDALDTVSQISKLINYSPKRKHLFSEIQMANEGQEATSGIKPLCMTRWTVRTEAIHAVLKHYQSIMETMEEVHSTTHDDYGLQAAGVLSSLEKFHVFFGLKLAHILFASAEETSKVLQAKDLLIQDATSAVSVTENFLRRHRKESEFEMFYSNAVDEASSLQIGEPVLPRYRKKPARFEDGTPSPPVFDSPKTYYCSLYKEAFGLLTKEIEDRFLQKDVMKPIVAMETVIMKGLQGRF